MSNLTYLSPEPWQRSITQSRNFKDMVNLLGFPIQLDSRGTYWPGSSRAINEVEKLWRWGGQKSGSSEPIKILRAVQAAIKKTGTHIQGESLVRHLLMNIRLNELSRSSGVKKKKVIVDSAAEQRQQRAEAKAREQILKMEKELEQIEGKLNE